MAKAFDVSLYGFIGLTLTSSFILSSFNTSAEELAHVSNVDISVPASCELTGTGTDSHTATINNGTYQENIGKTTLTVFCNDGGGYAIYAVGYTGEEIGATNSTKLVGVANDSLTINTGVYEQGTTTSSVWAMKLNKVTDATTSFSPANLTIENGYDSYNIVPASYTKVASFASSTDLTLGSKLETTYAVFISGTQRADTYNGKVKYTLVHPSSNIPNESKTCTAGKICYWPNAGNTVADTMGDQTVASEATEATLWASNFQRQGYGFAGWSTTYDYSDPDGFLGPNETIDDTTTLATIQSEGLSLYAYWIPSAGSLQDWNGCNAMNIGDVTALTDLRDNDTYAVAKLADGKCWMIENLRLDYDANITEALSLGFSGVFSGLAEPENQIQTNTNANSLYYSGTQSGNASIDIGTDNATVRFPRYNKPEAPSIMTSADQNVYSYGNYYSWAAAMANTNYYSGINATDADNKTSETAMTSICPSGWMLPYGRTSGNGNNPGGFSYYVNHVSSVSNDIRSYPNNYLLTGYLTSSFLGRGSYGYYWSSSSQSGSNSYNMYLTTGNIMPGTYNSSKGYGRSIRCVLY